MPFVKYYNELDVYKLAYDSSLKIFDLTKSFPKEELYSLTDQIRRKVFHHNIYANKNVKKLRKIHSKLLVVVNI